jgi:hypothetical protein
LVGGTNSKQRISYHYRQKGENLKLKQEKLVLADKLSKVNNKQTKKQTNANKQT